MRALSVLVAALGVACQRGQSAPAASADAGLLPPAAADAGAPVPATPDAGSASAPPDAGSGGSLTASGTGLLPATPAGWTAFAARGQTSATTSVSAGPDGYVLNVAGGGLPTVYGGWITHVAGLQGASWYRFNARARATAIDSLRESVTLVLRWTGVPEQVSPDYVWDFDRQPDGSITFDRPIQTPAGATGVDLQLILQWSSDGRIAFDKLSLVTIPAPPARKVRVASVYFRPDQTKSGLDSVQQAGQYAGQIATTYSPDVIVLGETLNYIGAPGTFETNAETVPGPSTNVIAGIASAHHVNIAFGMVERVGSVLFNTAVLIDRSGNIIGKHHKVQLPLAEAAGGLAPGDSVPVFDTDFGKVALLICQETSFPEPAREAALQGAEMLLVPIWGGKTALVHARAVENGIHLAASGYDYASEVVSPLGTVLASVTIGTGPKVAVADIDLGKRFREDWLGDWRDIVSKERRTTPYQVRLP